MNAFYIALLVRLRNLRKLRIWKTNLPALRIFYKVVPIFATKANFESGIEHTLIIFRGSRRSWVVRLRPQSLHPR